MLFTLLTREADLLVPEAQFQLGLCYEYGIGTQRSLIEAIQCYRAASANGEARGRRKIEFFSRNGFGEYLAAGKSVDWSLVYARLKEDYTRGEQQCEMQVMPTRYI